jgi:hypothetical protein
MAHFDLTSPENWYPYPGFPGYEVSSHFRVRSLIRYREGSPPGRLKQQRVMANGYLAVTLQRDGRSVNAYIHQAVAEIAHGPRPEGMNVLHRDDDKRNNDPSNLYYGTQRQNLGDAVRNGTCRFGQAAPRAKLTDDQVREIRLLLSSGMRRKDIAAWFGVSASLIDLIAWEKRWKHTV